MTPRLQPLGTTWRGVGAAVSAREAGGSSSAGAGRAGIRLLIAMRASRSASPPDGPLHLLATSTIAPRSRAFRTHYGNVALVAARQGPGLVRTVLRTGGGLRAALHLERGLRPAAGVRRHRGIAGACRHAGQGRRPVGRRSRGDRARHGADRRRDRARRVHLAAGARGRAPEHREAPDRTRRRCRQAAAHRTVAQRPGRARHPPVPARRDRRHRRRRWPTSSARSSPRRRGTRRP